MFQIRSEQMAGLRQARLREFEARLVAHVNSQFPDEASVLETTGGVLALVRRTIAHGQSLGISTERDLAALINLTVVYGEKFEDTVADPDVREVLHDAEMAPRTRLDLILEMLPQ
jgi:hypothetical protein